MSSGGTWIYREAPVLLPSDATFSMKLDFGGPVRPPRPTLHEILAGDLDAEVEEEAEPVEVAVDPGTMLRVKLIGRYKGVVTVE